MVLQEARLGHEKARRLGRRYGLYRWKWGLPNKAPRQGVRWCNSEQMLGILDQAVWRPRVNWLQYNVFHKGYILSSKQDSRAGLPRLGQALHLLKTPESEPTPHKVRPVREMVPSKVHGFESRTDGEIGRLFLRSLQYTITAEPSKEEDRLKYEHLVVSCALISNIEYTIDVYKQLHCYFAAETKAYHIFFN